MINGFSEKTLLISAHQQWFSFVLLHCVAETKIFRASKKSFNIALKKAV